MADLSIRLGAAIFVLLLTAGCGGEDEPEEPSAAGTTTIVTVTTVTTSADTTTGPFTEEVEARVESVLFRLSDFPSGWRAVPADEEDDEECGGVGRLRDRFDLLARKDSPTFVKGEATEAESSAAVVADEATAREAMNFLEGAVQSDEFRECLEDFLADQTERGVTFGDVQVGQLSFPRLADRSSAWQVVIPFEAEDFDTAAYIDVVYLQDGEMLGIALFSDVITPFDDALKERLVRTLAKRLAQS